MNGIKTKQQSSKCTNTQIINLYTKQFILSPVTDVYIVIKSKWNEAAHNMIIRSDIVQSSRQYRSVETGKDRCFFLINNFKSNIRC